MSSLSASNVPIGDRFAHAVTDSAHGFDEPHGKRHVALGAQTLHGDVDRVRTAFKIDVPHFGGNERLGWGAKFGPEGSSIIGSPSGNPE